MQHAASIKLREEAESKGLVKREEDVISYALYPGIAESFLKGVPISQSQNNKDEGKNKNKKENNTKRYKAIVDGKTYEVELL